MPQEPRADERAEQRLSIYVTSDGDAEGLPTSDKDAMLRVKKAKLQVRASVVSSVSAAL